MTEAREIVCDFYRTCGIRLGLWDRKARALTPEAEKHPTYAPNLAQARELLESGWKRHELQQRFQSYALNRQYRALIKDVVTRKREDGSEGLPLDPRRELLQQGAAYAHTRLKVPVPPRYRMEGGVPVLENRPSVSLLPSFTLRDLADYFQSELSLEARGDTFRSWLGQLNYLLDGGHSVDVLLTAIDLATDDPLQRIREPFDLSRFGPPGDEARRDYLRLAEERMEDMEKFPRG